jgi:hypothetical protein
MRHSRYQKTDQVHLIPQNSMMLNVSLMVLSPKTSLYRLLWMSRFSSRRFRSIKLSNSAHQRSLGMGFLTFKYQHRDVFLFDLLEDEWAVSGPDMHLKTCGPIRSPVHLIEGAEDSANCHPSSMNTQTCEINSTPTRQICGA